MHRQLWLLLIALLSLALVTGCVIQVTPQNLIYQSSAVEKLDLTAFRNKAYQGEMSVAVKTVSVTSEGGYKIRGIQALYHNARVNILIFGGNGMSINKSANIVHRFGAIPANVMWFDYPGVGISDKPVKLNSAAMMADALAVYDFATETLRNDKPFIVHGIELGSTVAATIATERNLDGLVLQGPIVNLSQLIKDNSPGMFTRWRLSDELRSVDNAYQIARYKGPLLIMVGEKDLTTPPKYSEILYRVSSSENKNLVVIEGAGHNKLMDSPIALDAYRSFIKSL
ncbi:alpha/beta hydrolase [Alteromonas gilva]|uniref:Alpha/beta hydrolase n=1 Tax=Alteromonas gilva TaxID=2987522 RepID=A0ABT5KY25_9ALTE|nr:alpha/beta hydrolase [Alteromonas gilva]MDC8829675.1 alpha/beta hydrolase [Alteromonas gilva]